MKDNLQSSLDSLRQQLEDANEQLQENQNLLSAESHKCLDLEQRLSLAKLNEEHLERRISQFERNEQNAQMRLDTVHSSLTVAFVSLPLPL